MRASGSTISSWMRWLFCARKCGVISGREWQAQRHEWLRQVPSIGPIRAALLIALMQTPHRFRTKRQLWAYSGLALQTSASGEYRFVEGQLQHSKRLLAIRGLNTNHNHDLKNIFKGAAIRAAVVPGPFQEFYAALVAKGMKPQTAFSPTGNRDQASFREGVSGVGLGRHDSIGAVLIPMWIGDECEASDPFNSRQRAARSGYSKPLPRMPFSIRSLCSSSS